MSNSVIEWARKVRGIDPSQKLILFLLADRSDDAGVSWPSVASLADDACLSERSAQRALSFLSDAGLMRSEGMGGRANTRRYTLSIHADPASLATPKRVTPVTERVTRVTQKRVTPMTGKGDTGDAKGDTHDGKGDAGGTRTIKNPQEPSENHQTPPPPVPVPVMPKPNAADDLAMAVSAWNAICGKRCGTVMKLSPPRAKSLALRLTELGGAGGWVAFCQRVNQSPFLTGQNGREWRADFDWVLKSSNALKIDEGRYDRRQAEAAPDPKAFLDDDLPEAMRVRPAAPYFDFEGQVEEVE